jgi:hypothetical protein
VGALKSNEYFRRLRDAENEGKTPSPRRGCLGGTEERWKNFGGELNDTVGKTRRVGRDERALKMNEKCPHSPPPPPFSLLALSEPATSSQLLIMHHASWPVVFVLLLSLQHSRNSQIVFSRFLTVPACQYLNISRSTFARRRHIVHGHFIPNSG